ncbi:MAG: phenylalanine 4-monooxygenase [Thermoanaerobaculia bacterium]|nr:phenylalanine 4-monooxygenase [Thermoanaerobaculia bacterium]
MSSILLESLACEFLVAQEWSRYRPEHHEAWSILYARRMARLATTASAVYLRGLEKIGLGPEVVPDLAAVNRRLAPLTGWSALPVSGFMPSGEFFHCLAERQFPTTITIRGLDSLDYITEPDIFHDVFGHVPLHADPVFADYLQEFGRLAAGTSDSRALEQLGRLFWFTVEFGLIRENGEVKVYGSGLISSSKDADNALSERAKRRPFCLDGVFDQQVKTDELQSVLFVLESFDQLFEATAEARRRLA